jgi:hypothetical protein
MRRDIICALALLGLTQLPGGAGAAAAANGLPIAASAATLKRMAPAAAADPALDLRFVPRPPLPRERPTALPALPAAPFDRFGGPRPESAERGLSFGLEVRRRPQFERRAWQNEENAPGLRDDIERVIEHSTLGVRGSYRF